VNFVALPVPEIIRMPKKFGQSLDTPKLPFLQKFLMGFCWVDPVNVLAKFVALPIPEIIAMRVLGGDCEPPI